jgi:chromosome segregation protein
MKPRLKALELHGYKTFASKIQFEFPGNITAIVGPNGSGKSNISDALRWVLGEQSYTLLRGKKTEDMIFAGSDQRPRAGMASATVVFDNEESWLPIDYTEVSVARRAYRDGNNEYLLNKQRVRLKDISELLAQSGLAERTYTIIGQGLVDAALSLRPEERRRFFEEAAGIGLFRSRREESLNRLDSTRRNLERVQDILSELEPRLRSLERQAKKADEYDHIKDDLHVLLKDWYGYHWQNTQKELLRCREILKNQEEKVNLAREKRVGIEARVQETRNQLAIVREQLSAWHMESAGYHSNREKTSKELAVLEERQRSLQELEGSVQSDIARTDEQINSQDQQLVVLMEERERLSKELLESQEQLTDAQKQLQLHQTERETVENQLRQQRRLLTDAETRQVQLRAHQRELTSRLETQQSTLTTLVSAIEQSEPQFKSLSELKERALNNFEKEKQNLEKLQKSIGEMDDEIRSTEKDEKAAFQELTETERSLSRMRAQFEVLEQAEMALSGLAEGAKNLIQAAKQGKLKGDLQTIGTLMDVPAQLEVAIGSVLGDQLDGIILDPSVDTEEVLQFLEESENGRAILLPRSWLQSAEKIKRLNDPDLIGIASELVETNEASRQVINLLLGQVIVVKNRKAARRLVSSIPANGRIVTLSGEVFAGSGVIIAGKDRRATIVGRPRQRKELEESIGELVTQKNSSETRIEGIRTKLQQLTHQREAMVQVGKNARTNLDVLEREYQTSNRTFEQHQQKSEWQKSQLSLVNIDLNKSKEEIILIEEQIKDGSAKINELNISMQDFNTRLRAVPLDEYQSQVAHWNTTVAVNARGVSDADRRYNEFLQTINQSKSALGSLNNRLSGIKTQLVEVETLKTTLNENEKVVNQMIQVLGVKIDPAEVDLQKLESEYSGLQEGYTQAQQVETNYERNSTQAQLELARTRESLESLRRKIEEDFGLVTLDYSEDISGPTPLPLEGVSELKVITEIPQGLEESINRQRALMRRMGAINPDAQREFYEVRERYEFLSEQMEDLKKADTDLRQIISELDDMMRKQFRSTFNAVAIEFKQMFTRLFGGGSARLILTDDENPTETGIDIEAKLPGRREQGLLLLSGGERALTAVALIFALLKVSPTPFCVMDEVDAMLDEANVGRFTELLKELSLETQFIVITHNRNTVQVADVIYGVTMGRDSASQVISLRLDEVSDEMVRK